MNKKHTYEYRLNGELQKSLSKPGPLEQDITYSLDNDAQLNKLITKTSELDNLTVCDMRRNFLYPVIWIVLAIVAGMALFHFLL